MRRFSPRGPRPHMRSAITVPASRHSRPRSREANRVLAARSCARVICILLRRPRRRVRVKSGVIPPSVLFYRNEHSDVVLTFNIGAHFRDPRRDVLGGAMYATIASGLLRGGLAGVLLGVQACAQYQITVP